MTTTTKPCSDTSAASAKKTSRSAPAAVEPCCTSLECIEKPRFFCGQLLTDLDLEAAMSYIAAKNRLHNRYLFGPGVVNGLAVKCDPCEPGKVVVEPGYALDCLGNDIIVCAEQSFDVKEALDCRRKKEQAECTGTKSRVMKECGGVETEYCLVISYAEKPSRPINALVHDQGCRTGKCESSRTREVFRLELLDEQSARAANVLPDVWSRIRSCLGAETTKVVGFLNELSAIEAEPASKSLPLVYQRMRAAIVDYAERIDLAHCDLVDKLCEIDRRFRLSQGTVSTDPNGNSLGIGTISNQPETSAVVVRSLFLLYVQLIIDCVCSAFLMPPADCCEPEHVLLACLNVRDGKVISICNTVRTQVVSGVSARYWLQPLFTLVGQAMEYLCCTFDLSTLLRQDKGFSTAAAQQRRASTGTNVAARYASSLFRQFTAAAVNVPDQASPPPAVDLVNLPVAEAQARLSRAGIESTVTTAKTMEEAYSFDNLKSLGLTFNKQAHVELIVAPDGLVVSGFRVKERS